MLKVKEWLKNKSKAQFEVTRRVGSNEWMIQAVRRLKDDARFSCDLYIEYDFGEKEENKKIVIFFTDFEEDLIHVKFLKVYYEGGKEFHRERDLAEINDFRQIPTGSIFDQEAINEDLV